MSKKVLIVIFLITLLSFIGSLFLFNHNKKEITKNNSENKKIPIINTIPKEEIKTNETSTTSDDDKQTTDISNTTTDSKIENRNNDNSNQNKESSKSNNTNKNTSSNSNNENVNTSTPTPTTPVVEEEKPESVPTTPKENTYIGVPNPNDFYYSLHRGRIDDAYTTLDGCYNKGIEITFLENNDIKNVFCYEVLDGQNTVLGIYMDVVCSSGNCDKYKKMLGINTK